MLKKAVKLLRGSVCVRAKSAYPERMLNLCSARGIEFWDVRWIDDTALSFCVARGDLRALRRAAEGCGAEVSIERTAGTPFFFARLRRRHALFAGGILCAALLLVNSLFIWDFEVTGNETVPTETILHALREHGVHRGTLSTRSARRISATAFCRSSRPSAGWRSTCAAARPMCRCASACAHPSG